MTRESYERWLGCDHLLQAYKLGRRNCNERGGTMQTSTTHHRKSPDRLRLVSDETNTFLSIPTTPSHFFISSFRKSLALPPPLGTFAALGGSKYVKEIGRRGSDGQTLLSSYAPTTERSYDTLNPPILSTRACAANPKGPRNRTKMRQARLTKQIYRREGHQIHARFHKSV